MTGDEQFDARVQALLSHAVAGLDPQDRAERIAWCRAHDELGVRMHLSEADDLLEFRWGGRTLCLIHRDVLDNSDGPIRAELINELPDQIPADWQTD